MPKRTDIESILVLGSGPIVIGQACEFDYSGTQACRALRSEGYRVVLVNSNPATIMTDPEFADATYVEPLDRDTVAVIVDFFDDLVPARMALDQYFSDANHLGPERAAALHLLGLSNAWRRGCDHALVAVRQLHGYLGRLPAQYASNSRVLIDLLQDVARGGSPCLDANGKIDYGKLSQPEYLAVRQHSPALVHLGPSAKRW